MAWKRGAQRGLGTSRGPRLGQHQEAEPRFLVERGSGCPGQPPAQGLSQCPLLAQEGAQAVGKPGVAVTWEAGKELEAQGQSTGTVQVPRREEGRRRQSTQTEWPEKQVPRSPEAERQCHRGQAPESHCLLAGDKATRSRRLLDALVLVAEIEG